MVTRSWGAAAALLALAALALAAVVMTLAVRLPADLSLNYGEGFVQLDAQRLARGEPIYGDPEEPPYTLHVYPPLYTALVAAGLRLGGNGYTPGRLIGYGAVLATALLIARAGRGRSGRLAWSVAAFYLTLPIFVPWGALVRPDNLAVLFSALGVRVVDRRLGRPGLVWAAPLFLAALLCKQSAIAGLGAAALVLARRDPRGLLRFGTVLVAGGLLALAGLELASGGRFWLHAVGAHADKPFHLARAWALERAFFAMDAPTALFAAALAAWVVWRRRASIDAWWLAFATLTTLSAGADGSDTNYFLEPVAALAFLAARELRWPAADAPAGRRLAAGLGAAVAVACAAWNVRLHHLNDAWIADGERSFAAAVARWGAAADGPIVSDDAGFLVATGTPLYFRPFIMTQLARSGAWDETPVVDAVRERRIALLVLQREPASLYGSRYTPALREAIARHYRRAGGYRTDFAYEIWVPKPR